jgi:hypothetical protein
MNKVHVTSAGVGASFLALGLNLFFPKLNLSADQMAFIVGVVPGVVMTAIKVIEVVFPKSKAVIDAVTADAPSADAPIPMVLLHP